eukprot:3484048-Alexandrium_andersonii.AAC.1
MALLMLMAGMVPTPTTHSNTLRGRTFLFANDTHETNLLARACSMVLFGKGHNYMSCCWPPSEHVKNQRIPKP